MSNRVGRLAPPTPEPVVFPPYVFRRALYQILSLSTPKGLPTLPRWLKYFLLSLILVNIKSFPLLWHVHVFYNAVASREKARPSKHPLLFWIRSNKVITTSPGVTPRLRLDSMPIGRDIFTDKDVVRYRATPDDCDWNMHLSNSSYAKNLDYNRIGFLAKRFLRAHFDGSHFALGGATYAFHAEVPMMARYDVEMSVGSWDEKWLYVVGRFVSPSNDDEVRREEAAALAPSKMSKSAQNLKDLLADVVKPSYESEAAAAAAAKRHQSADKSDERKVYCTSISRYCFKAGRKTIPPWFAIATSGYGTYASTRTNWDKAENLRRNVQKQRKADYLEQNRRPMPRDSFVLGSAYRKAGIMSAYDPSRVEDAVDDDRGLGAWQDRKNWNLAEWEERRVRRLAALAALGGVVSSKPHPDAGALDEHD